jgi:hypothetical protein
MSGAIKCDQQMSLMATIWCHWFHRNAADASWIGELTLPDRNQLQLIFSLTTLAAWHGESTA